MFRKPTKSTSIEKPTPLEPRKPIIRETVVTDRLVFSDGSSEVVIVGIEEVAMDKWRVWFMIDSSFNPEPWVVVLAYVGLSKERALLSARTLGEAIMLNNQMNREQLVENAHVDKAQEH